MNHSINDGHLGTSKATSKDIYATWNPSAIKSDFEPSRHHRSASGYPSGPDYVSSSRRHAENPTSGRDYKPRNVSESQPLPASSHMRYRESHYADAVHPRPSHRKESTVDPAAYTSASKRHAHDPGVVRNNNSAEDVVQYPRVAKYERWIPPNQPSPPSQAQEAHHKERDKYEKEREKDKQKSRDDYYRERRDEVDVREKHKRRYNEGDSDWDKDRERKERREKERYRELEREKAKEQERERTREEFERTRAKEKVKERDRHREEREQERYAEKERQRAIEKDREMGREREKEREKERRRQKERESGQERKRDRKEAEKHENPRPKADLERERKKERELVNPERDYRHEVEKGRDSDRELLDRRKRKLDWESEKEREKAKEISRRVGDMPVLTHEGRRREVEHEGARKVQDVYRRDPPEGGSIPLAVREQDVDKPRSSKKDTDSPRQRELHKANEKLEADRALYINKESVSRREYKSYEKSKRSPGNRPHADRATDSEKENPSQRDAGLLNPHLRGTVLRSTVEPEPTPTSRPPPLPLKQTRDERTSYAFPMGYNITTRVMAPTFSATPGIAASHDGFGGHPLPLSRPVDQTLSTTPKYSPISVASAESQKMDMGTSENKAKQGVSSQRALRRQSKMSSLVPDQTAVLPLSYVASKHNAPHIIPGNRVDAVTQLPLNNAFRIEKEDATRLHSTQVPVDSPFHNIIVPPAAPTKMDIRTSSSTHKMTSGNANTRSHVRNSTAIIPPASIYERPIVETSQPIPSTPRDLQGSSSVHGIQMVTQRALNDCDTKQRPSASVNKTHLNINDNITGSHPANQTASGHLAPPPVSRNPLDKMGRHINTLSDVPAMPAHNSTPASNSPLNVVVKTSSKGVVKGPNASSAGFEPEVKVTTEKSRVVPQPGLIAVPLEMQQGLKRGGESIVDKVQNASEVLMRRPPSLQGSTKEVIFLEPPQEQKREKALVADTVRNTFEVPLRRPPSAAGWSTPRGSIREGPHPEMQPDLKRERGDNAQSIPEAPLQRPPSVIGWPTLQSTTREAIHSETQHESKIEKVPVADRVQNASETPLRMLSSVAGLSAPQGGAKEAGHFSLQQELKRDRILVADQNFSEAPLRMPPSTVGWPALQSSAKEPHLDQESKREKMSFADRVPYHSEMPPRMPSAAPGWPVLQVNAKEPAHLEQEPKRDKVLAADRMQNYSEVPLRISSSVAGWPTLHASAHLDPQQEPKREKALVVDRTQAAPEVPLRLSSSAAMQGSVREVAHLETQQEPKREKVPVANRIQSAPDAPPRRPPSAAGWPTPQSNFREAASLETQELKREKAPVTNGVQNTFEVAPRSAAGLLAPHGSAREAMHLETQHEPKRAPAVDKVQNVTDAPLRIPSSTPGRPTIHGGAKEVPHLDSQQELKRDKTDGLQNVSEAHLRVPTLPGSIREAASSETQQESKREKVLVVDRVQNVPEIAPRRPLSTAGWSTLQGSIREAPSLETQRELKRERLPVAEAVLLETLQEPKSGREPVVDRAQNSSETPSRMHPPAAGWSSLQGNIREAAPLGTQHDPKRERASTSDRAQNALEVPPRRPPSAAGWSTSQGSTRDKVTPSNVNPSEFPPYATEQLIDGGVSGVHMASSVRTTSFYAPKQEGLLSRVQAKAPIPEDNSTPPSNGTLPSIQPETSFQRIIPDRFNPPEPSAMPLKNIRSAGEPNATTPTPVTKTHLSKSSGDGASRNKQVAGDTHPTSSTSQENVPFVLSSQRGDRNGFNPRSREDQAHMEPFQSNSPAISLRRDPSIQPPLNKPSNVIEVPQTVPSRPPPSNYSRSAKAGEELIVAASHSSSSRPSEETYIHTTPIVLERHVEQPDAGAQSLKDPIVSARTKGDRMSSVGPYTGQEFMTLPRGAPAGDGINTAPLDAVSVVSRDKNTRHPRQADHRHSPDTPLRQTIGNVTYASDILQRQFRDASTDKKPQAQVNNRFDAQGPQEEKVHNHHTEGQAPEDKKPTIQHEALARILDQPLDRHAKKTRTSPSTQSSHSGLPQEEPQMPSNEVDHRHPVSGTPKSMLRSSSSMSHNPPSPVVKTLSHTNHGTNNKSNINQENLAQDPYNRPNISATGYPHPVYRSSSLYPAVNSSTSHTSSESSKNQMHPLHTLPIHSHANLYQSSMIEAGQTRNSPSHQTNLLTSNPPVPAKRPPADTTENSDPTSSRHFNTHTKASNSGSRTDVSPYYQSRPSDVPSISRTLDTANSRGAFNDAVHLDNGSRAQESSPGTAPTASLLFSKSTDLNGPFEHKGNADISTPIINHPAKGMGNPYTSSPTSYELENHEPRLITPRIQKHPELAEEPRKKSHSLDVAKAKPPDDVHKKSVSLEAVKSKLHEQRPHEIWHPPHRDEQSEVKTKIQPSSAVGSVTDKGVPAAPPVDKGRNKSSIKPEHARHGRKSPNIVNMKVYRYLREKRNRTISAVSMEAQDGTAPSTVVGSPTASVISQAPPIHIPSPRDPMKAAQDWLTEGIEAAMLQGRRRILRPGVVFDVAEDPPPDEQRHRSKRPRTQNRRP